MLYSLALLCLFAIPGAIIGATRAKRRNASARGVYFTAFAFGFVSAAVLMLLSFVAVMVLWGMSI